MCVLVAITVSTIVISWVTGWLARDLSSLLPQQLFVWIAMFIPTATLISWVMGWLARNLIALIPKEIFVWTLISLVMIAVVFWIVGWTSRKHFVKRKMNTIPPNTVCLYQTGRGPCTPSLSPFPLKLETFLRMAKVPYMNDHGAQFSSKGKTPWMMYNGQIIEDSQICIEFLKEECPHIDVNKGLTAEQLAISRSFRALAEENLYWTMCHESFLRTPRTLDILLKDIFPWWKTFLFKKGLGWKVKNELWGQGIGRHSDAEIWDISRKDLTAISNFLGDKPYLMGESPHEVDCTVFGMLAMVLWQMRTTRHEHFFQNELTNLVEYCERMRDRFWPDWEQRCVGVNYENDHGKYLDPEKYPPHKAGPTLSW